MTSGAFRDTLRARGFARGAVWVTDDRTGASLMAGFLSFDFTPFQALMIACAVIEAGLIFAQLRYVPKTPQTRRLQTAALGVGFVVIIGAALFKLRLVA
ncbi:hypothetical protein FIV34_15200 [Luteibacter pinisoli]|uniref:Uncharacterized protein n=1 Tax=Luteibacter pinisoli TaxID=2589080 RepID=A0A4Y5Z5P9_9GAMM|nr:hypothetical protein [Luteibacter pinisoli]QDE40454.1 hypothetical protein FIV34_15200 [Luteibacter pinisoli]